MTTKKSPKHIKMPNNYAIAIQWDEVKEVTSNLTSTEVKLLYTLLDTAITITHDNEDTSSTTIHDISYRDFGFQSLVHFKKALTSIQSVRLSSDLKSKTTFSLNIIQGWKYVNGTKKLEMHWNTDFLHDMVIFRYNKGQNNYLSFFLLDHQQIKYYYPVMQYFLRIVNVKKTITLRISDADWRDLTGTTKTYLDTNKNPEFKSLNRRVIKPVVEALNSEDNGLKVEFLSRDKSSGDLTFKITNTGINYKQSIEDHACPRKMIIEHHDSPNPTITNIPDGDFSVLPSDNTHPSPKTQNPLRHSSISSISPDQISFNDEIL